MKKIISLSFMFVLTGSLIMAQSKAKEKVSFAVLGGVNYQNQTGKDFNGNKLSSTGIIGFHAGVNAQIEIVPEFYFQPGLLFSTKGSEITESGITGKYRLSYIELPLNLVYKSQLGSGFVMIGFGPYAAYGINGKATYDTDLGSVKSVVEFKNEVATGDPLTTTYFKALDIGGNLFAGYEMAGGVFLQLNTQFGMVNILPDDNRIIESKAALKNIGFGLSLGYRF
ncbi:MAG: outer membrane beta-barrel protein [Saprospiraceae bacterium]